MPKIIQNHHVLAVPDKQVAADFFIEKLGFAEIYSDSGWTLIQKDSCIIMLGECKDAIHPSKLGDHSWFSYLVVDDADRYYDDLKNKNVQINIPIGDKPWGMREFAIQTPDGFRISIGHRIQ